MPKRTYVQVTAQFDEDGNARPLSLIFNGKRFEIDRVISRCQAAATKAGGQGIRYTIRIHDQETFLFQDEKQRWFVEEKDHVQQI